MIKEIFIDNIKLFHEIEKLIDTNISIVFFDTEFYRRNTYWAELCLLQLKIQNFIFLIDTQKINIKNTFIEKIFTNPKIIKVCHACEQDLNVLKHIDIQVENCFDTQIAAAFCREGYILSYQTLISKFLNIEINKSYQDALWNKRPLIDEMITYAANDVKYLEGLFDILSKKLNKLERFEWVMYEVENVRYQTKKKTMLQLWRENIAKESNLPPNWVLNNKVMHKLSCESNQNHADIAKMLPTKLKSKSQEVFDIIQSTPKNKENINVNLQNAINTLIKIIAEQENIPPHWLCDSENVRFICANKKTSYSIYNWRYQILNKKINDFFEGNLGICFKGGNLVLEKNT